MGIILQEQHKQQLLFMQKIDISLTSNINWIQILGPVQNSRAVLKGSEKVEVFPRGKGRSELKFERGPVERFTKCPATRPH